MRPAAYEWDARRARPAAYGLDDAFQKEVCLTGLTCSAYDCLLRNQDAESRAVSDRLIGKEMQWSRLNRPEHG
jgi:hypothetical protein